MLVALEEGDLGPRRGPPNPSPEPRSRISRPEVGAVAPGPPRGWRRVLERCSREGPESRTAAPASNSAYQVQSLPTARLLGSPPAFSSSCLHQLTRNPAPPGPAPELRGSASCAAHLAEGSGSHGWRTSVSCVRGRSASPPRQGGGARGDPARVRRPHAEHLVSRRGPRRRPLRS